MDVVLVDLAGSAGREIRKPRPCLVVSPDELNRRLGTVIVAPMTTKTRDYPFRVDCVFQERKGQIALDQLRTLDRSRLRAKLGRMDQSAGKQVLATLAAMFAP